MTLHALSHVGEPAGASDLYQATLDSLEEHVAVLDGHGTIVTTNLAWRRYAEANGGRGTGVGACYFDACTDAAGAEVAEALRDMLAGGRETFRYHYECHSPGRERWFELQATRFEDAGDLRVVVKHQDVSSRVRAERETSIRTRELSSARDHLRAVTDSMDEGLFVSDVDGRMTYLNASAERMLGWTSEQLKGRPSHTVLNHSHERGSAFEEHDCPVVRARREGVTERVDDEVFVRRDGRLLPVAYTAAPFETPAGVRGSVVVFRDITKRRGEQQRTADELAALGWIARIRAALDQDRFVLYAQPIVDVATGVTVQHELLIRMLDDDGGVIAPGQFLPVAEEYGLIREIDRWVIDQAAALAALGHPLELNLSAVSLGDCDLYAEVERALTAHGTDPSLLVFELTETSLLRDEDAARSFIERVEQLGYKVALDDFGTGYGGFTYLKRLPIDYLKIDVEFVRDLGHDASSEHVVRAVVSLARGFGQQTIAEGVEDAQTLVSLRRLGVDFAQGYAIGRPAPAIHVLGART